MNTMGFFIPLALGILPWSLLVTRITSWFLGVATGVVFFLAVPFGISCLSPLLHTPLQTNFIFGTLFVGAIGYFLLRKAPISRKEYELRTRPSELFAILLGPVVFLYSIIVVSLRIGSPYISWVTNNDSANNILIMRTLLYSDGVTFGPGQNPVPLTHSLMAQVTLPGREFLESSEILRQDLFSLTILWTFIILLICLMSGILSLSITRSLIPNPTAGAISLSAGIGSTVPLLWFISGYPIEYGFLNSQIVILVLLTSLVIVFSSKKRPYLSLSLLFVSATLVLASWSPLIVFSGAILLVGIMTILKERKKPTVLEGASVVASMIQFLTYVFFSVIPVYLSDSGALASTGGALQFSPYLLPVSILIALLLVTVSSPSKLSPIFLVTLLMSVLSLAGLAFLLYRASGWTYYPMKYAWTSSVILLLVLPGLLVPFIRAVSRKMLSLNVSSALALLITCLAVVSIQPDFRTTVPPLSMFEDSSQSQVANSTINFVMATADLENPRILWSTNNPSQAQINFWLLQIAANGLGSPGPTDTWYLRVSAYEMLGGRQDPEFFCELTRRLGPGVEVYTSDPNLDSLASSSCGETSFKKVTYFYEPAK